MTGSTTDEDDARALRQLVEECLERFEEEGSAAFDDVCARRPDLETKVRGRLRTLRDAGLLGDDPSREIPERLGDFKLVRRLGSGGMGVVYLAVQESLGREVALKLVRPEQLFFPGARERFRREVDAVARLEHPGIVPIYTVGEAAGVPYFAMECVRGVSLADVIAGAGAPAQGLAGDDLRAAAAASAGGTASGSRLFDGSWLQAVCRTVRDVALALEHAHERGVVHRDVKPSNIMVTPEGRVLLLDFGLARAAGTASFTRSGSQLGSLPYMAPEQLRGQADRIGPRTDVYGLGVTMYELLTLQAPYAGDGPEATQADIFAGAAPPPSRLNPAVGRDAETICLAAMDPDPDRRYRSAAALAEDLERFLELRPIAAHRPGTWLRVRRAAQRNPAWVAAILVITFALGAWGVLAHQAGERVRVAREQAKRRLENGVAAVRGLLRRAGVERGRQLPSSDPSARALLEEALRIEKSFRDDASGDPMIHLLRARALHHLGNVQELLGAHAKAEAGFRKALAVYEAMQGPPDGSRTLGRAQVHRDLASLLRDRSDFERARLEAGAAIELLEKAPEPSNTKHTLASCRLTLGMIELRAGGLEKALTGFRTATEIWRELAAEQEGVGEATFGLGHASHGSGNALQLLGRYSDARAAYVRAKAFFERFIAAHPRRVEARLELASALSNLAGLASRGGDFQTAEKECRAALAIWDDMCDSFPQRPDYTDDAENTRRHLAFILLQSGDHAEAMAAIDRAGATQRELVERFPEMAEYRHHLATILGTRANILAKQGRVRDAHRAFQASYAEMRKLCERHPSAPVYQYDAAMGLLLLAAGSRGARANKALSLAVEHLRTACGLSPNDASFRDRLGLALVAYASFLCSKRRFEEALEATREAVRDAGVDRTALANSITHRFLGKRADYREIYEAARER